MMAGTEDDIGGLELSSHQDLVDCDGTKIDCNGNGNVRDDLGASYVFVCSVGDVDGCRLSVEENCDVKGDGVVGNDQDFAVGMVMDKYVDLHSEFVGEVGESAMSGELDFEGTVEDRGEFDPGEDLESRTGNGLDIGESKGTVIVVSAGDDEMLDKGGKDVEENVLVSTVEVGESEKSDMIGLRDVECELGKVEAEVGEEEAKEQTELKSVEGDLEIKDQSYFKQMKDLGGYAESGESQEGVIKLADTGEFDKSVKAVEQDIVVSPADFGEGNEFNIVALGDDICESAEIQAGIEVDVGEGKLKDQTELNLVEEGLESDIRTTKSVDCASHDLEENQYKFEHMTALDSEIDGGVQMGNEISTVADEEIICMAASDDCKDLDKCIDGSQSVDKLDSTPPYTATPCSMDKVPTECSENITSGTVDCAVVECEASKSVLVQGIGTVNLMELDYNIEQTCAELIEHVPAKTFGSVLASIDDGTVSGQGPVDVDGGVRMCNDTSAEVDIGTICTAAADDFKDHDKCIDGSQIVDKLDLSFSDTATPCFMDKVPIECSENITSCTDDCVAGEHEASKRVLVLGIGTVNSMELDCNINQTCAELIEHVPAKIFGSALASIDDGTVSDQGPVDADCGVGQGQGYDTERVALDTDGTLTTETATRSVTDQSKMSQINLGEQRSGCTKSPELNGNPDNAHSDGIVPQVQSDKILQSDCNGATILEPEVCNLVCPITANKSESETKHLHTEDVESRIFSVTDGTKSGTEVANGLSSYAPNDVRSEIKIEFGTIDSAEVVAKSWGRNSLSKSQVLNGDIDCNRKQSIFNLVEPEDCADMSLKFDVQNHFDMHGNDATIAECSIGENVDGRRLGNVAKAKPLQFLAKFPRIDDDKLRERIIDAQVLVEEKTVLRNNIRCEIEIKRANLQSLGDEFEATKSDERAARRLVKIKRQEIDSVQDKINRAKNSISVMDITNRIAHMEHLIEHETLPLKEEKQLLREINVLKKLRGQISSNVCSAKEVTPALSQLEPTEMQLKTLKKELSDLKDKVSQAEAAVILLGKECNDESKKIRALQARFRAANDIRQDAYKDLLGLKRQMHEKGKHFWIYKDDAKAASEYAVNGDKEALHHLCAKQVDTFMDLWNKNDEFREDYVRCNMKSTLRRLKTLDGRSLGPDEKVHVFPVYVGERESRQLNNPSRTTNPSSPTIMKQENTVTPVEREPLDGKSLVMTEAKSKMLKSKTSVNPIPDSGLHIGFRQLEVEETKEVAKQKTEEELELARKDEILRKEEIDAKLKEQLRLEEKVKAQEALERKKRNADKAQMRALLRAQKEAEQKEKEREKRLRKKEKKTTDGENGLELQTNHVKEESKDSPTTKPIKTSHFTRYNKTKATLPPALRNRGKRGLKQFMWWIFGALIVLFIFLVGNSGAFKNLRPRKDDSFLGNHQSAQPIWQS